MRTCYAESELCTVSGTKGKRRYDPSEAMIQGEEHSTDKIWLQD